MQFRSFTTYGQRLLSVLQNEIGIIATRSDPRKSVRFKAIWDTGAELTVITERVVSECGLKESGKTELHGVHGSALTPTYLVDIILPNKVKVTEVTVAQAPLTGDADVLIGMDIIGLGDFAVSSYKGATCFSFRVPSKERIDFLPPKHRKGGIRRAEARVGRNDPCTCGSGKKYKNCCGR